VFHESDRAQIAVIYRHKLHERIIVPRVETKAVAGASESPRIGRNSVVPERASPSERRELLLSSSCNTRTSTFRYGKRVYFQRRSRPYRCKMIVRNRYLFKRMTKRSITFRGNEFVLYT